jgi:hypothetical protein
MAYSSSLSAFSFDGTTIPAVGNIAFSFARTPMDVTSIGAWNTYFIDGVASAAFTLDVFFSHADHNKLITDVMNPVTSAGSKPFIITLGTVGANVEKIEGYCIITSWDSVAASSDVVRASFSCQVTGPIKFTGSANGGDLVDIGNAETVPT